MKKLFKGLIAFVVTCVILLATVFIFLDSIIKYAIETGGTKAVGAKVELSEVDLSLSPLGLTLMGLEITDPEAPMRNMMEVKRTAFLVDGGALFERKVIIEDMALEGVRFSTPRQTSGAIAPVTQKEPDNKSAFALPSFDTPDIKSILENENLLSLEIARKLESDINSKEAEWKTRLSNLPDSKKLKVFEARIKKLQSGGFGNLKKLKKKAKEAKAIKNDIKADLDIIKTASKDLKADIKTLEADFRRAKKAPAEDVKRLKGKYGLTPSGLKNFSRLLLGAKLNQWIDKSLSIYSKLTPYLNMSNSKSENTTKKKDFFFLAKRVFTSIELESGTYTGSLNDVTNEQSITQKPMTFLFDSEKLNSTGTVKLKGELNHINPASSMDKGTLAIKGLGVSNVTLSDSAQFPLHMKEGRVELTAKAIIENGNLLADFRADFRALTLNSKTDSSGNQVLNAMSSALERVKSFKVKAQVKGTLKDYHISLSSDLDKVLEASIGALVKKESDKLELKLKRAIGGKSGNKLKELEAKMGQFRGHEDKLKSLQDKFKSQGKL